MLRRLPKLFRKVKKEHIETILVLGVLFGISVFFRFYNLNWDQGLTFHPDERNIANAVGQIRFFSQLNPHFFAYGGFSIYLYRAAGELLVWLTKNTDWVNSWGSINLLGRFFSALFASLTLIPLYFLAKDMYNKQAALLAALVYAFCVGAIQIAHFATTESLLTGLGVTIAWLSLLLYKKLTIPRAIFLALTYGISIATKTSGALFFLFPLLAFVIPVLQRRNSIIKTLLLFISFGLLSLAVFSIFSPYTFLDWQDFMASMHYESGVATGSLPVVYTLQFTKTIPYLFQLVNFLWQIGPLVPFGVLGVFLTLWLLFKTKDMKYVIFLGFPLVYFFYVGSWHTKFIRYMLPFIPFFVIMGSAFLVWLQKKWTLLAHICIAIVLFGTVMWAISYFSIYTRPQTRIAASVWMYQHIPVGSKILTEAWDDGLPVNLAPFTPDRFPGEALNIYDTDNEQKKIYYAEKLSTADYIVINSRRLYGTLMYLPEKYPLTSKYYKKLFAGKLGYEKVGEFSSYPTFLTIPINDDASEETFQVYDHPKVLIFKNTGHFSEEDLMRILSLP